MWDTLDTGRIKVVLELPGRQSQWICDMHTAYDKARKLANKYNAEIVTEKPFTFTVKRRDA